MRAEIERDMRLMGCRSVADLSRRNLRFRRDRPARFLSACATRAASIASRIRRMAASRPTKIASPTMKWPMLSSRSSGRAAMGATLS